jgi:acyl dehydratase
MSLLSAMYYDAIPQIEGLKMGINIGFDRLRFLAPVKSTDKIRGVFKLSKITEKSPDVIKLTWSTKVEIEGNARPALLAIWIERQYF